MSRIVSTCVRIPLLLLLASTPAAAATLYVAPAGADANPGTLSLPLATPARALALAAPGDTILLRGGTYPITRSLQITQAGLTLASYPGERARIAGGTADLTNLTSILIVYASGVTIDGLEIEGASYYGIKLDDAYGVQTGATLRGLYIHHTGRDGIKAQRADGLLIDGCEIAFTGIRDASNAEGIDIMATIGVTIRRSFIHDIATNGIFVKAGTRQAVIEANRVERTGYSGILLGSESDAAFMRDGALYEAADSVARNNLVVDAAFSGLGSIAGDNVRFEHNTVINAARVGQAAFRAAPNEYRTPTRGVVLHNNVFVLTPGSTRPMVHLYDYQGAITSDANIWFSVDGRYSFWREAAGGSSYWSSLAQWRAGMNADWISQAADPGLDPAALYRPLAGSAAVDRGLAIADLTVDYSGSVRPQGAAHDVGAHEQPALSEPPPPPPPVPVAPAAPMALSATQLSRATVALAWSDASSNEEGFRIERSTDRGAFVVIATVGAGAQGFTDGAVRMNRTYAYRVAAVNAAGASPYSNTVSVTVRK